MTEASIACKVGNALVSVRFGRDEAERARFDKFYKHYALQVWNGDKAASITVATEETEIPTTEETEPPTTTASAEATTATSVSASSTSEAHCSNRPFLKEK